MPATPEELFQHFTRIGVTVNTVEHPPLHTVEESRSLRGDLPGGHCKNLLLRDNKKRMFLLVCLEDRSVDLKSLPEKIGSGRLSFASPDRLMEFLGVMPGSVTPFALINDREQKVRVFLDRAMMEEHDLLNYHPLINTMTSAITPADLLTFIRDIGHEPDLVDL